MSIDKMSVLAKSGTYEIGKLMNGCVYLLAGDVFNTNFDSVFHAVHAVTDPAVRWDLARQITPYREDDYNDY